MYFVVLIKRILNSMNMSEMVRIFLAVQSHATSFACANYYMLSILLMTRPDVFIIFPNDEQ